MERTEDWRWPLGTASGCVSWEVFVSIPVYPGPGTRGVCVCDTCTWLPAHRSCLGVQPIHSPERSSLQQCFPRDGSQPPRKCTLGGLLDTDRGRGEMPLGAGGTLGELPQTKLAFDSTETSLAFCASLGPGFLCFRFLIMACVPPPPAPSPPDGTRFASKVGVGSTWT